MDSFVPSNLFSPEVRPSAFSGEFGESGPSWRFIPIDYHTVRAVVRLNSSPLNYSGKPPMLGSATIAWVSLAALTRRFRQRSRFSR